MKLIKWALEWIGWALLSVVLVGLFFAGWFIWAEMARVAVRGY